MNMNCNDINTQLDDYLDDRLDASSRLSFNAHVKQCGYCQQQLVRAQQILAELRQQPVPAPSKHFKQQAFAAVRQHHSKPHAKIFVAGFASAIAASFMLWFTSSLLFTTPELPQTPTVSIAMHEIRTVRLMIDAEADISQARLSIDLPDNMRIDGYPQDTQIAWQTDLSQGQNVLSLPLKAIDPGEGELVARVSYGESSKEFRFAIKTADDGALNYQLLPIKSA
jgi:hypothetical protein